MFTNNSKSYPQQYSDMEILKVIEENSAKLRQNLMSHSGIVSPSWFNSIIELWVIMNSIKGIRIDFFSKLTNST
jgi:hypothetical protein